MNSEQFCKTEEWIEFRDALWKKFYHMESSLYFIEDKQEWIDDEVSVIDPHGKGVKYVIEEFTSVR